MVQLLRGGASLAGEVGLVMSMMMLKASGARFGASAPAPAC